MEMRELVFWTAVLLAVVIAYQLADLGVRWLRRRLLGESVQVHDQHHANPEHQN
jgi:hypothetical protein